MHRFHISVLLKCCQPTLVPISSAAPGAWNTLFPSLPLALPCGPTRCHSTWEVLFPCTLVLLMVRSPTGLPGPFLLLLPGSWKYSDSLVTCGLEGELSESRWSFFLL